jgi:hypothetical protein
VALAAAFPQEVKTRQPQCGPSPAGLPEAERKGADQVVGGEEPVGTMPARIAPVAELLSLHQPALAPGHEIGFTEGARVRR